MEKKSLFCIKFLFLCLGNGHLLFQTKNGRLWTIGNDWVYILGTEARDLKAIMAMDIKKQKSQLFWAESEVIVEARNVCECLDYFLALIRHGHLCLIDPDGFASDRKLFIDQKICQFEATYGKIDFKNWPIKIRSIKEFPYCDQMLSRWKEKGLLTCCADTERIVPSDLCPIVCYNSVIDDGECAGSAYALRGDESLPEEEVKIHGLKFSLIKVPAV